MRCRDFLPYRIKCYIARYGNCSACRGCRSACRGRPADKSLAVRSGEAVCGKRICACRNACDVCHCARTAVCIEADGIGCGRCSSAYRHGCFYNREAGGDILIGLAGDEFKLRQSDLKRACRARVNGALEGCYHGVCRAFVVCGGSHAVDHYSRFAVFCAFGIVGGVKAELGFQSRRQTSGAGDVRQSGGNIQNHLN